MNILVCFKAVPDLESLAGSDWQPDDRFWIETRYVKTVLNLQDESALELTLKFRDKAEAMGLEVKLEALFLGQASADSIFRTLAALKFDRLTRLASEADLRFNPEKVAGQLCSFIRRNKPYGLIIMGGRSADGDNAAVPFLTAEMLGLPCLSQISAFSPRSDSSIEAAAATDEGEMSLMVTTPLVLAVGNAPSSCLRVPTLKDRLSYGKNKIEILPLYEEEYSGDQKLKLISLEREESRRAGEIIDGPSPAAKAALIYDRYLRGRP